MTISLLVLLVVTVLATFWARRLADRRRRHVGWWAFATAMLPPLVLLLWALPARDPV